VVQWSSGPVAPFVPQGHAWISLWTSRGRGGGSWSAPARADGERERGRGRGRGRERGARERPAGRGAGQGGCSRRVNQGGGSYLRTGQDRTGQDRTGLPVVPVVPVLPVADAVITGWFCEVETDRGHIPGELPLLILARVASIHSAGTALRLAQSTRGARTCDRDRARVGAWSVQDVPG